MNTPYRQVYVVYDERDRRTLFSNQEAAVVFLEKQGIRPCAGCADYHTELLFDSWKEWESFDLEEHRKIAMNKLTQREKEALGLKA